MDQSSRLSSLGDNHVNSVLRSIRLKCVHTPTSDNKIISIGLPPQFEDFSNQLQTLFGPVRAVYKHCKDNRIVISNQKNIEDAVALYTQATPMKPSMKITLSDLKQPNNLPQSTSQYSGVPTTRKRSISGGVVPATAREKSLSGTSQLAVNLDSRFHHRSPPRRERADTVHSMESKSPPRKLVYEEQQSRRTSPPPGEFVPHVSPQSHRRSRSGGIQPTQRNQGEEGRFIPEGFTHGNNNHDDATVNRSASLSSSFHGLTSLARLTTRSDDSFTSSVERSGSSTSMDSRSDRRFDWEENLSKNLSRSNSSYSATKYGLSSSYEGRIRSVSGSTNSKRKMLRPTSDDVQSQLQGLSFNSTSSEPSDFRDRRGSNASIRSFGSSNVDFSSASNGITFRNPKNWLKGQHLGSGAFGQVYLGSDKDTGLDFAVKQVMLHSESGNDNMKEVQSLEREIQLLKNLRHERIVTYYGTERTPEYLAIFMEYVPGRSIHARLVEYGAFSEDLVKKYTKQVLEGLIYLHENKIVHRDIKGANVLADSAGNIKLADFGASKRLQSIKSMSGHKSVHGTPYWMSPEAIQGSSQTYKSDIWSVGALVVEMTTTHPPFWEHNPMTALFKIANIDDVQLIIPSEASKATKNFITRCFDKRPQQRPDAHELIGDAFLLQ
eukprot:m.159129 g.159129  ORF g.159129 m.159129 type:complete len:663 (-) comp31121_c0_seq2:370-2358(-)